MLRRIHDPERGAGFTEYAAVILLVAAITAGVVGMGIPGRVADLIGGGVDGVESAPDGQGDDGADGGAAQGTGLPGADGEPEPPGWQDAAPAVDTTQPAADSGDSGIRTVGFLDDPLGSLGDTASEFGGGLIEGGLGMAEGIWEMSPPNTAWNFITDPSGTFGERVDVVEGAFDDPLGLFISPETRESWGDGHYAEAFGFGFGVWDAAGLFLRGRTPPRTPDGIGPRR
ncbi:hypothetical protein ACFOVU_11280 [Nocardiopsis sediminis]|uniref:Flp family type IVb pilin n=1 Tax=Nocardiopsis sediminis TaxID=1778267 RepID=A0ABV8FMF0_9ACTN